MTLPKFRAWHRDEEKMYEVVAVGYRVDKFMNTIIDDNDFAYRGDDYGVWIKTGVLACVFVPISEVVLMQCTHMKCKNDVEVWGGDIIRDEKGNAWIVRYEYGGYNISHLDDVSEMEVIGNIFENPDRWVEITDE